MAKKQINFYNLAQYQADCENNKYLKTLVLSYFCLTREIDIISGLSKIEKENNWNVLYDEYKRYHSGEDIQIENEKLDLFDPSLMESIRDTTAGA